MAPKKYEELTHQIIGCAMRVHSTLGNGFQEVIYQRCLAIELEKTNIPYQRELEIPIYYDGHDVGTRRADFVIRKKVLVELKALIKLEDVHLAQALNYLEAYRLDVGLLINFGARSLEFKRLLSRSNKSRQFSDPPDPTSPIPSNLGNPPNPTNPDSDNDFSFQSFKSGESRS